MWFVGPDLADFLAWKPLQLVVHVVLHHCWVSTARGFHRLILLCLHWYDNLMSTYYSGGKTDIFQVSRQEATICSSVKSVGFCPNICDVKFLLLIQDESVICFNEDCKHSKTVPSVHIDCTLASNAGPSSPSRQDSVVATFCRQFKAYNFCAWFSNYIVGSIALQKLIFTLHVRRQHTFFGTI